MSYDPERIRRRLEERPRGYANPLHGVYPDDLRALLRCCLWEDPALRRRLSRYGRRHGLESIPP